MATSRAAQPPYPFRRPAPRHARPTAFPRALGVAGLATATTLAFLPAGAAVADPTPSATELQRRVQALDSQASMAVEDFRQAEQQLDQAQRRAAAAQERAAAEQARLEQVRAQMSGVVAAAYRRGGNDRLVALVSDQSPQAFLDRASALDRIARSQADVLALIETTASRADAQHAAAQKQLAALEAARQQLEQRQQQVERTLQAQQRLLEGLERRQVEAARAAVESPRASRGRVVESPAPTYTGPASGRAKVAIEEGYRQLGKPYRYGGSGPDSFDCSGFTSWVWRAAGVSLPRTSRDQYAQGRKVAKADLQPGDLVYFGSPIHHVGMYLGDGQMINSPQSGGQVRIQPAFRSDYVGATRP